MYFISKQMTQFEFSIDLDEFHEVKELKRKIINELKAKCPNDNLNEDELKFKYVDNEGDCVLIKDRLAMEDIKKYAVSLQVKSKNRSLKKVKTEN